MKRLIGGVRHPGVLAALVSALLFGVGAPLAKQLLVHVSPWLMAGLLYAGSGIGLSIYRIVRPRPRGPLSHADFGYLAVAVLAGGVIAPVLLMKGLASLAAADGSLLLNAEGVFTATLAWLVFRENVDRRLVVGMIAISLGAIVLSWSPAASVGSLLPTLLVLGACFAWGIDNNVTRKLALLDATWLACVKGIVAGTANLLIAIWLESTWPSAFASVGALLVGALAYGASLVLFVVALRYLGAARTGAYFSTAPFIGAVLSVVAFGEPVTVPLLIAFVLMALGVWLHLTERHVHEHRHQEMDHDHEHVHDEHHQHDHEFPVAPGVRHRHAHYHAPLVHFHQHYPDAHHRHDHD